MSNHIEGLAYVSGNSSTAVPTTVAELDATVAETVSREFVLAQRQELIRRHQEQLHEDITTVTMPYEIFLTSLAQDAEVARRERYLTENQSTRWRGRKSRIMEESFADGEYTETDYLVAENGNKYPYSITYRAEGKGPVGEGRVVTPVRYSQVLRPGDKYPDYMTDMRDSYNFDLLAINLSEGRIQDVSLSLPVGVAKGNGLMEREGTQTLKAVSDGLMFSHQAYWTSLQINFNFNDLMKDKPGLSLQHLITHRPAGQQNYYKIKPVRFEYSYNASENKFTGARYDKWNVRTDYSPDAYTGLLYGALRLIPAGKSVPHNSRYF